jgi:hypothetical protein
MCLDPFSRLRPSPPIPCWADLFVEPKRICTTWPPLRGVFTISGWRINSRRMFCTADWTTWTSKWRNWCDCTVTTDRFAPTQIQIPASGWRWVVYKDENLYWIWKSWYEIVQIVIYRLGWLEFWASHNFKTGKIIIMLMSNCWPTPSSGSYNFSVVMVRLERRKITFPLLIDDSWYSLL